MLNVMIGNKIMQNVEIIIMIIKLKVIIIIIEI